MYTALPFAPSLLIAAQPGCTTCGTAGAGNGGGGGGGGSGGSGSGGGGGGSGGPTGYPPGVYPLGGGLVYVNGVGVVSADELPGMDLAPTGGGGDATLRKRRSIDLFWLLAILALTTGLVIGRRKGT